MLRHYSIAAGLIVAAFSLGLFVDDLPKASAQSSDRVVEIRMYTIADGMLERHAKRMGTDSRQFFEKHGMESILYSTAADPPLSENTFIYLLAHESRAAAEESWASVLQDPDFQAMMDRTGRMSTNAEVIFVNPTDYSPLR